MHLESFPIPNDLVPHPRYGDKPWVTGVDFQGQRHGGFVKDPSWKYSNERVIPNTGVIANITKQRHGTIPIYVYYDVLKRCVDCDRPFIFYADEQKFWFETLGFAIDANCIRCTECRKKQQAKERSNKEYQRLVNLGEKTWLDYLNLANGALDLAEDGKMEALDRIRGFINRIPEEERHRVQYRQLVQRMKRVEEKQHRDGIG
jgi:hypothetical protein